MPKRDPILALPTEIWQMILRYSISVPGFLDPDEMVDQFPPWVIASRGWAHSASYYEAERTRNALRRACQSWDKYLQRYAHRYVCIFDVMHGHVPLHYFQTAVRISLRNGDHDYALCEECKPREVIPKLAHIYEKYINFSLFCRDILSYGSPTQAKILDHGPGNRVLDLGAVSYYFPNLVRIQAMDEIVNGEKLIKVVESLRALRYVYTPLDWSSGCPLSLKSSTLTTLHLNIHISDSSFVVPTKEALYLPSLRHLYIERVWGVEPIGYQEPLWLPLVKIIGKELRTLYLPMEITGHKIDRIPGEIWAFCPKLEELSVLYGSPPTARPPVGHPIHTLGVSENFAISRCPIEECVPDWPGLRTVRIGTFWDLWKARYGPLESSLANWFASRRLSLEDCSGEPYTEYIPSLEPKIVGS
jgi:hypothetical protein